MPRSVRYFPVNHDINADPEVWELTDKFGDRALRVWLEILSIADRNYGQLDGTVDGWAGVLMRVYSSRNPRWVNRDLENLQNLLRWMSEKGWITIRERSEGDQKALRERSEPCLQIANYSKYHKTRGENSSPPNLTYPNLTKPTPIVPKGDGHFDRLWNECPKKVGKGAAEKAWHKIKPDKELAEKIIAAMIAHRNSAQWLKDGGQYIPHPATWLNQKRWEDEIDSNNEPEDPIWAPAKLPLTRAE